MHRLSVLFGRVCDSPAVSPYTIHDIDALRMKALLFTLIRAFEFELAVPGTSIAVIYLLDPIILSSKIFTSASQVMKKSFIVSRPVLTTEPERNQLPLLIKPCRAV